ncbi:hypothetical protein ABPG74_000266 [Tetrahymena malaccensis]
MVTYFYFYKKFNQSKYINLMLTSLLIYQTLLLAVLVLNILSLIFSIIQKVIDSSFLSWYDNIANVDSKRIQLVLALGASTLNALISVITFKIQEYMKKVLSNHYTISNIRVFNHIQNSTAALRQNLIKIGKREFDTFIKDQQSCLICEYRFGLGQYIYRLKCKHVFHSMCFSQWVNVPFNNSCPSCLNPL